ncbi:hypothetical protein Nmel_005355 [Mimus melanotis]
MCWNSEVRIRILCKDQEIRTTAAYGRMQSPGELPLLCPMERGWKAAKKGKEQANVLLL